MTGTSAEAPSNALELRYHPKADQRTALVMASAIVPWTLYFALGDTPSFWWVWPILVGLSGAVAVWAHVRLLSRRPVALTISDQGLVHHDRDGRPTWHFPWADIISVEFEERLVEGPILVLQLTEEAQARHWDARISMNRIAGSDLGGHHHIGANITRLDPEELFGLIEDRVEVRRLEGVRRAKAELDGRA